jgi:uncharacterized lipoprotein YmbA
MTDMKLGRRRLIGLAVPVAAAACSASPNPVLYTIETRPGSTFGAGPKIVMLRDISLASYLDRKEIVRSSEDYKLGVMSNDWWGESLGALLARVLIVELSQRLPDSRVYGESGAIAADSNATVGVNIQRLDNDKAGVLVVLAQVAVEFNRPRRTAARNFTIAKPAPTPNVAGQVAAISDAMADLANGIAALLQP